MRFSSFDALLAHQARELGERPALCFAGADSPCSWQRFDRLVRERAEFWRRSGKTCLGVFCDGSFDCVVNLFAANLAGMQVVLLDENTPDEQLPGLLAYTDVDVLWGDEDLCSALTSGLTGGVTGGAGRLLFFTSGTTDSSKAVVLTDASLCASAWNGNELLPLSGNDRLLCLLPMNHVFGFVCGLLWGLQAGACVALSEPRRAFTAFSDIRPTAVSLVPAQLGYLLKAGSFNPELKTVLIGAGDCPASLLHAGRQAGLNISVGYGLTETSSGVALSAEGNPNAMTLCPDVRITFAGDGEILVSAPTCMMQGYYKRPADTAAVLSDGILHTGDLGALDGQGRLRVTGRKKEMLVLADGTKIFLPEYEAEIGAVLGTAELAVVLRDGRPVLVLSGAEEPKEVLLQKLAGVLSGRARGQQLTDIIILGEPLPRTATGKLRRWAIARRLERL